MNVRRTLEMLRRPLVEAVNRLRTHELSAKMTSRIQKKEEALRLAQDLPGWQRKPINNAG